jgi:hypothetical protein
MMETITVYRDTYEELQDREFKLMTQLAELKGTINALADMQDNPEFVFKILKETVDKFDS